MAYRYLNKSKNLFQLFAEGPPWIPCFISPGLMFIYFPRHMRLTSFLEEMFEIWGNWQITLTWITLPSKTMKTFGYSWQVLMLDWWWMTEGEVFKAAFCFQQAWTWDYLRKLKTLEETLFGMEKKGCKFNVGLFLIWWTHKVDWWMLGTHWPASVNEMVSTRFSKRLSYFISIAVKNYSGKNHLGGERDLLL